MVKPRHRDTRRLALDIFRVTEQTAIATAAWRGRGDEQAADAAAAEAMLAELNRLEIKGHIVVGVDREDGLSGLREGAEVGTGKGPEVDIAVDPLEGKTLCAKHLADALAVVALAPRGGLKAVGTGYMEKLAVAALPEGARLTLDMPPSEIVGTLAEARRKSARDVIVCVLDRPRHNRLIEAIREAGAAVRLISDGDIAGAMSVGGETRPADLYLGTGGAAQGVLAAAALRALGGEFHGRLVEGRLARQDRNAGGAILRETDLAAGDVLFAATGITDGTLLQGVRMAGDAIVTDSLVTRSGSGTVRRMLTHHRLGEAVPHAG